MLVHETAYKFQGLLCMHVCAHSCVLLFLNFILEDSLAFRGAMWATSRGIGTLGSRTWEPRESQSWSRQAALHTSI